MKFQTVTKSHRINASSTERVRDVSLPASVQRGGTRPNKCYQPARSRIDDDPARRPRQTLSAIALWAERISWIFEIRLFGSRAKGTARPGSDIDRGTHEGRGVRRRRGGHLSTRRARLDRGLRLQGRSLLLSKAVLACGRVWRHVAFESGRGQTQHGSVRAPRRRHGRCHRQRGLQRCGGVVERTAGARTSGMAGSPQRPRQNPVKHTERNRSQNV
jgi:Nucleotidyltransferase domain